MKASKAQLSRFAKACFDMMKCEKHDRFALLISCVLLVLTIALPLWKIVPSIEAKPFIPLHYNVIFGIDRFGSWRSIFWIPAIGLFSLLLNLVLGTLSYRNEKFMTTLLLISGVGVQLTLLCSMLFIVLVNL